MSEESDDQVVRIPAGRPFMLIVYESQGASEFSLTASPTLSAGMLGAVGHYLDEQSRDLYRQLFAVRRAQQQPTVMPVRGRLSS